MLGAGGCGKKEELVIFATARSQGKIRTDEASGVGGFAVFKALYDAEPGPKLALDLGGWTSPLEPEGWFSKGRSCVDCLSAVPYAAAAAGFTDLSLAPKDLQNLAEAAKLPILASNLYLRNNKKPDFLRSWHIVSAGSRKVGVFSLAVNSPANYNSQKHLPGYKLEKATYEAERAIRALRENGAGLVVMLLVVNPAEKADQEFFRGLLAKLPRLDLVITDEPSLKKPFKVNRAWVAPAGLGMSRAARLALRLDAGGRVAGLKYSQPELDPEKYGEEAEMLKVIAGHERALAAHFGRKIGFLNASLPLEEGGAYPAADFAADCMRRWARTNSAIIPLKEPAAGFSSGPVTTGDLYRAFPQDSSVVFVKIRGEDLERALAALRPAELSVSGLRLFLHNGTLERVETETGPLAPGRIYQVAVPDSLTSGRDNPVLYSAAEFANSKRHLRDVMGWCFSLRTAFARPPGGRVMVSGDK